MQRLHLQTLIVKTPSSAVQPLNPNKFVNVIKYMRNASQIEDMQDLLLHSRNPELGGEIAAASARKKINAGGGPRSLRHRESGE